MMKTQQIRVAQRQKCPVFVEVGLTLRWPEVVGTVAGDDTIFVAAARARDAGRIRKKILAQLAP